MVSTRSSAPLVGLTLGERLDRLEAQALSEMESVDLLEEAASCSEDERTVLGPRVEAVISRTTSRSVRNAAAIALIDLGRVEAAPTLNALLSRPDLANEAGTLVFAIDELGASLSLEAVLNLVERGSYEARAEMILLLEEGRLEASSDREVELATRRLADLAGGRDPAMAEVAALAQDRLPVRLARAS